MNRSTIKNSLATLSITNAQLQGCSDLEEQFNFIKKSYFKQILVAHPDKGGDPDKFRNINTAWEIIRKVKQDRKIKSFAAAGAEMDEERSAEQSPGFQSYEFYFNAAEEDVPIYRMELAKSGRSKCTQKTKLQKKCEDTIVYPIS